ncbi:transcriptional regulator, TetR family, partial [mine drainage metagenome]
MVQKNMEEKIIDVAQQLVQSRGFNAFSYRDLADRISIRTASIHYYFPKKDD